MRIKSSVDNFIRIILASSLLISCTSKVSSSARQVAGAGVDSAKDKEEETAAEGQGAGKEKEEDPEAKDEASSDPDAAGAPTPSTADTVSPTLAQSSLSITAITNSSALLAWTKASDDVTPASGLAYKVYVSLNAADVDTLAHINAASLAASNGSSGQLDIDSYSLSSLQVGTTYYVNVVALDAAGNGVVYTVGNFTTSSDIVAPTLSSASIGAGSVTEAGMQLSWTKATDDESAQTDLRYFIYASTTSTQVDSLAHITAANLTPLNGAGGSADINSYTVAGLQPSTTYYINVVARDLAGNFAIYAGVTQATTADATAPVLSSASISGSAIGDVAYTLNWTKATDAVTAQANLKYFIYVSTTASQVDTLAHINASGLTPANGGTGSANINSYTITGRSPSTTYYANVVVRDAAGNEVAYTSLTQATTADAPPEVSPTTVTTSAPSDAGFSLAWTKATDNVTAQASLKYYIYVSTVAAEVDTLAHITGASLTAVNGAGSTNINSYTVTGLSPATTYYTNVVVEDAASNRSIYAGASRATSTDATAPSLSSTTITASSVTDAGFALAWTKATDNGTAQASLKYFVYVSTSSTQIDTLTHINASGLTPVNGSGGSTDINSYTVSGLLPATTYYANVVVKDTATNSIAYSQVTQATSADVTVPSLSSATLTTATPTDGGFTLSWTKATDVGTAQASLKYFVYVSTSSTQVDTLAHITGASLTPVNGAGGSTNINTYTLTGLTPGTTYYTNVVVRDAASNDAIYTYATRATSADTTAPTVTSATLTPGTVTMTDVPLSWTKATDNGTAQASLVYYVYVSTMASHVDTLAHINSAGLTPANGAGGGTDINSYTVTSLTAGTTYYFNVVVADAASQKLAYTSVSRTTSSVTATQLVFTTQPANTVAGASMANVVVQAQDGSGNLDTGWTQNVAISFETDPSSGAASIGGTTTVAAVGGIATFSNLTVNKVFSGYKFKVSSTAFGATTYASNAFNTTYGTATALAFVAQPPSWYVSVNMRPSIQVKVVDAYGNTVGNASNAIVVALGAGSPSATLTGGGSTAASSGVATFSSLNIDTIGSSYTYTATSSGLTSITSNSFNITQLKYMAYISSDTFDGNLTAAYGGKTSFIDGLTGADYRCNYTSASTSGSLVQRVSGRYFKAALSTSTINMVNRFLFQGQVINTNSTPDNITTSGTELFNMNNLLSNLIVYDETGTLVSSTEKIASGAGYDGTYDTNNSCTDWTSTSGNKNVGVVGSRLTPQATGNQSHWVNSTNLACSTQAHLACVEQRFGPPMVSFTAKTGSASGSVDLTLKLPTDLSQYADGVIKIYRKAGATPIKEDCATDGSAVLATSINVTTGSSTTQTYQDTGLSASTVYTYRACAYVDAAASFMGFSMPSNKTVSGGTYQVAFVSSSTHTGNLGGLSGANTICTNLAAASTNLPTRSNWYAILGTPSSAVNANTNLITSTSVVYNPLGDVVVSSPGAGFWGGNPDLTSLIRYDENGASVGGSGVYTWTGSQWAGNIYDSTATNYCTDWSSSSAGQNGYQGDTSILQGQWVVANTNMAACNSLRHLYCISSSN